MLQQPVTAVTVLNDIVTGPHGPILVRRYTPAQGGEWVGDVPMVWVHGGAFVSGGLDQLETHRVALDLAGRGHPIITVDYRLTTRPGMRRSPRQGWRVVANHYPVPMDDVVAVVRNAQARFPGGVVLGGASAGACLSAGAVLRLAADGDPALRGVFLAYGLFHAVMPQRTPELASRIRGLRRFLHTPGLVAISNLNYAGTRAALAEPFAFAGGHPLGDFPPTLMLDADHDSLRASGGAFGEELRAACVPTEYHVIPNTSHAFLNRPNDPGFAAGLALLDAWLRRLP